MLNRIARARRVMRRAFKKDPAFKASYIANVACVLMDNIPGLKRGAAAGGLRTDIAEKVLDRIFSK